MATYNTIADGLRLSGSTGCTNDLVNSWLKGLSLTGTTPDMLFTYLRSTGLTGSLSDMLSTYVFGQINFIELEADANAYYSLSSDWVAAGDFEVEMDFSTTSAANQALTGAASDDDITILANGTVRITDGVGSVVTVATVNDGELHKIRVVRTSGTAEISIDGVSSASGVLSSAFDVGFIGRDVGGNYFDGIISNPKLTNLSTPANSLAFTLGELTANSEVNNGVTLTYNNIATTQDVRDTYTLTDGAWLGTDFGATSATAVNAPWVSNGGSSYSIDGSQAAQTTIFYDSFLSTPATYVVEITTTNSTAGGVRPETSEIELAYSTGNTTTRWEFTTISNGNFNIQADANYDGNITYTIRNKIDIAAQAPAPTALFNSSGVLTCNGTLACASTIPCGA